MRVISANGGHKIAGHRGGWGRCTTCLHKDRAAIEAAIIAGSSLASTAKQFGLSVSALQRHMDRHERDRDLVIVTQALPVASNGNGSGDSTADRLLQLLAVVEKILGTAGSATQVLDAIREARALVVAHGAWTMERERIAMLRQPTATVNIQSSEEWVAIRTVFMRVTAAHDRQHGHSTRADRIQLQLADAFAKLAEEHPDD